MLTMFITLSTLEMHNKCYSELKLRLYAPKKLLNHLPFNLVLKLDYDLHSEHRPITFMTHLVSSFL